MQLEIYSVLITEDNWDFKDNLMDSFLEKKMIPVCSVSKGEDFEKVKEELKNSDGDTLLLIVHILKYIEKFEA
jgi:hypothetical protein